METMAIHARRIIEEHHTGRTTPASPFPHELIVVFVGHVRWVAHLAERRDLGSAKQHVGLGDIALVVSMCDGVPMAGDATEALLEMLGRDFFRGEVRMTVQAQRVIRLLIRLRRKRVSLSAALWPLTFASGDGPPEDTESNGHGQTGNDTTTSDPTR